MSIETNFQAIGVIRQLDKDYSTFTLRGNGVERVIEFEGQLRNTVLDAFRGDYTVIVRGVTRPGSKDLAQMVGETL